jgi:HD-GYP domain-containing protein (c-di-GMP phosphodiesterase class II)
VAVAELRRNAGTQFDPDLAERFIEVMESRRKEEEAA